MTDLESALRSGFELRGELDAATDHLNECIAHAETALKGLRLGVAARVPMLVDGEHGVWLGFTKLDNQWRIVLETYQGPKFVEREPLANAPRHRRMDSIEFFPALAMALCEAIDKEIAKVKNAGAQADDFVAFLRKNGAPK